MHQPVQPGARLGGDPVERLVGRRADPDVVRVAGDAVRAERPDDVGALLLA